MKLQFFYGHEWLNINNFLRFNLIHKRCQISMHYLLWEDLEHLGANIFKADSASSVFIIEEYHLEYHWRIDQISCTKELLSSLSVRLFLNKLYLNEHKPLPSRGLWSEKGNSDLPTKENVRHLESSGWTCNVETKALDQSDLARILGLPYACSVTLGKLILYLLISFLRSRVGITTYLPQWGAVKIKMMDAKDLELFLAYRKCSVYFSCSWCFCSYS